MSAIGQSAGDARDVLAIDGGEAVRRAAFPAWPVFSPDEVEAVANVLRSGQVNYWTGDQGRAFEREYAEYVGCKYAVAVANGSAALELALHSLSVGPGDEVIVTSRSFIASASCVVLRGARPVFVDVDRNSQNVTAETIARAVTSRTRAIIVVHLAGWPCEMDAIVELAREHGLKVVEDCAQAHGATYCGRQVGALADVAAFSFCQDKILSTGGEGGMVTTNDRNMWERAWSFKDHGKSWSAVYETVHPTGYRLLHHSVGTNWRMTEMQAALGRVLLRKLPERLARRRRNARAFFDGVSGLSALRVPAVPRHVEHSYYRLCVYVRSEFLRGGWDRHRIQNAIVAEGVPCVSGYGPLYRERAFASVPGADRELQVTEELAKTGLMFQSHSNLGEAEIGDTVRAVQKVFAEASR